jgi:beta-glucosidase
VVTVGSSAADADMARRVDGIANRVWLEPVLRGAYPADVREDWEPLGFETVVRDGDLAVISAPIDAIGLNYYRRHHVRASAVARAGRDWQQWPGTEHVDLVQPAGPVTDGGWAIEPDGLHETLAMVAAYDPPPLYVEECGAAFDEPFDDERRIRFLDAHLRSAHRALQADIDLRGFFVWTWFDNFEWAEGYAHRFGLIHIDRTTMTRTGTSASCAPVRSTASARWRDGPPGSSAPPTPRPPRPHLTDAACGVATGWAGQGGPTPLSHPLRRLLACPRRPRPSMR